MLTLNPFPLRLVKTGLFINLFCLMPDEFTCQGKVTGWEMVNWAKI